MRESGSEQIIRPALARCLDIDPEDFATNVWSIGPHVSHVDDDFADLFSQQAVDELVSTHGLRTPFARMANQGKLVSESSYTGSTGSGAGVPDQLIDDKVFRYFSDGASLVLQGLHRTWRPLRLFSDQLALDLGHPIQINAYITPPQSQGFASHHDTHDVFVIQIAGTKQWRIHRPVITDPTADQTFDTVKPQIAKAAEQEPFLDTRLECGDVLYLPRGWIHSATADGEVSIHLTIGIHQFTRMDVLRRAINQLAQSEEFRASLPIGAGTSPRSLDDEVARTLKDVAATIESVSVPTLSDNIARNFRRQTRPEPIGPLEQLAAVRGLTPEGQLRLRRGLVATVSELEDGRIRLICGARRLTMPSQCRAALDQFATGEVLTVGRLPELDEADSLTLSRRLLSEAVAVIVDDPS